MFKKIEESIKMLEVENANIQNNIQIINNLINKKNIKENEKEGPNIRKEENENIRKEVENKKEEGKIKKEEREQKKDGEYDKRKHIADNNYYNAPVEVPQGKFDNENESSEECDVENI